MSLALWPSLASMWKSYASSSTTSLISPSREAYSALHPPGSEGPAPKPCAIYPPPSVQVSLTRFILHEWSTKCQARSLPNHA